VPRAYAVEDATDQRMRDLRYGSSIRGGTAGRLKLDHPADDLAEDSSAFEQLRNQLVERIRGTNEVVLITHEPIEPSGARSRPCAACQTRSNVFGAGNEKTPDLSEASISRPFVIAGAGFEPATFGLGIELPRLV
jgi:hypothetical protein